MKQEKMTVAVVLDSRRKNNEDQSPLKLRITYKGNRRYYGIGYNVTTEQWETVNSMIAKGKLREIKNSVAIIENDAKNCCNGISPFSFIHFEKEFFDQRKQYENVKSAYDVYIKELKAN